MNIAHKARALIAERLGNAMLDAPDSARFLEDEFGVEILDVASEKFVTIGPPEYGDVSDAGVDVSSILSRTSLSSGTCLLNVFS